MRSAFLAVAETALVKWGVNKSEDTIKTWAKFRLYKSVSVGTSLKERFLKEVRISKDVDQAKD